MSDGIVAKDAAMIVDDVAIGTNDSTTGRKRRIRSRLFARGSVGGLNGRSAEGKFCKRMEASLLAQLGCEPAPVQRALIMRATRIALHLEMIDRRALAAGGMTLADADAYSALTGAMGRLLRSIGLKAKAEPPKGPSLAEWRKHRDQGVAS
jgi:hypothetical protein